MDFSDEYVELVAEPDIPYVEYEGRRYMEPYEKNPEIILCFGKMNGKIVIKSILIPSFFDQLVKDNYIFNIRKNNRTHTCPICKSVEKKLFG